MRLYQYFGLALFHLQDIIDDIGIIIITTRRACYVGTIELLADRTVLEMLHTWLEGWNIEGNEPGT